MISKSLFNETVKFSGSIPAGNYEVIVSDVELEEAVSMFHKELPKEICGKQKSTLTPDQIKKIEDFDLGDDGFFKDGSPKPRFQNKTNIVFTEPNSGITMRFDAKFYGGPSISAGGKLEKWITQATGLSNAEMAGKSFAEILGNKRYNAVISLVNGFNHVEMDTVRLVGLPPIAGDSEEAKSDEPLESNGFTRSGNRMLKYLTGKGAGMKQSDLPKLPLMHVEVDGESLGDFQTIMRAWNEVKGKVKVFSEDNETVKITV